MFNWESYPHSQFPQELIIQLEHRAEIAHIVLEAKTGMEIAGMTIYVGDQVAAGSQQGIADVKFRLAGNAKQISSLSQNRVEVFGIGTHIRLRFDKPESARVGL